MHPDKGLAHMLAAGKACLARNGLDRQPALLQHQPRGFEAQRLDSLGRSGAGLRSEQPRKLTRTEAGRASQRLDGQIRAQVLPGVIQCILDPVSLVLRSISVECCDCPPERRW